MYRPTLLALGIAAAVAASSPFSRQGAATAAGITMAEAVGLGYSEGSDLDLRSGPRYYSPPPVYYAPPPVYYAPPLVYYAPPAYYPRY